MIQVYTGNGKGKTTAALGLALRASGAGIRVYIGQFIKGGCYSELNALKKIKNIEVKQFGRGCFIKGKPRAKDIELAKKGLKKVSEVILSRKFGLVILDEINVAVRLRLCKAEEVLALINKAGRNSEIILTGRYAHPKILEAADLVSQIKEAKHYFKRGIKARKGIEY